MATATKGPKPQINEPLTPSQLQHHSQELGKLGGWFGSRLNAPVYFAGVLALLSLLGAILVGLCAPDSSGKWDLVKSLIGIVVAALSFIGGASGRPNQ